MKPERANSEAAPTLNKSADKSDNPIYFENEVIDHLISIVLELGAGLWVVKDRLAFMEELLENQGISLQQQLDQGRPSEALQESLKEERKKMIRRIYSRLYAQYGGDKSADTVAPM